MSQARPHAHDRGKRLSKVGGFTIVELVVILVVLAAFTVLLLPALTGGKAKALRVRCAGNQRQIGMAFQKYAQDHNGSYPVTAGWAASGGKCWSNAYTSGSTWEFGGGVAEASRPLNAYVKAVELFWCPSDRGDPLTPQVPSCWQGWGNSYLVAWHDGYRVQHVTGDTVPVVPGPPITTSTIALSPSNKIIQGDWDWRGDRNRNDPRTTWHSGVGTRRLNMLFGDGHVELYDFPAAMDGWGNVPPDRKFLWW